MTFLGNWSYPKNYGNTISASIRWVEHLLLPQDFIGQLPMRLTRSGAGVYVGLQPHSAQVTISVEHEVLSCYYIYLSKDLHMQVVLSTLSIIYLFK